MKLKLILTRLDSNLHHVLKVVKYYLITEKY